MSLLVLTTITLAEPEFGIPEDARLFDGRLIAHEASAGDRFGDSVDAIWPFLVVGVPADDQGQNPGRLVVYFAKDDTAKSCKLTKRHFLVGTQSSLWF